MKTCSVCKQTKSLSEFHRNRTTKDGYRADCKDCFNTYCRERYAKDPDKFREYNRTLSERSDQKERKRLREAIRLLNPLALLHKREKSNEWNKAHREKTREANRKWYEANKEKGVAATRKWQKEHPQEHRKAQTRFQNNRIHQKRAGGGGITNAERDALFAKYDHRCLCCKRNDVVLTLDHVVPLSKGGTHTIDNVQPLCQSCNARKNTKTIDYRNK